MTTQDAEDAKIRDNAIRYVSPRTWNEELCATRGRGLGEVLNEIQTDIDEFNDCLDTEPQREFPELKQGFLWRPNPQSFVSSGILLSKYIGQEIFPAPSGGHTNWCNCLGDGEHIHEGGLILYKDGTNRNEPKDADWGEQDMEDSYNDYDIINNEVKTMNYEEEMDKNFPTFAALSRTAIRRKLEEPSRQQARIHYKNLRL